MNRITTTGVLAALALMTPALGGAAALGKTTHHAAKSKPKAVTVNCSSSLSDQIDSNGVPVTTSAESGSQYGTVHCSKLVAGGVESTSFTTNGSGDLGGTWHAYFNGGTVAGTFDLAQNDGSDSSSDDFAAVSYTGTVKVTGGTGTEKGLTGTGTETCTSKDSLHLSCSEKLTLKPAA